MQVEVFWVVTTCWMEAARSSKTMGILPRHYTASQAGRPRLKYSPPWKPQNIASRVM